MKTTNWQTKALTLFIAAATLWLATACTGGESIGCTHESPELTSKLNTSEEEYQEQEYNNWLAWQARDKYDSLFWRQPHVYDVSTGFLRDDEDGWTDEWGIIVWVTKKVDQRTLPPEDRIHSYLDSVPIQIMETKPPPKTTRSSCDYSMCRAYFEERAVNIATLPEITDEYTHEVRLKYNPLFNRQPNYRSVGEGFFQDENGEIIWDIAGIVVKVAGKMHQDALPPEDRIPDCLEGVPMQIIEWYPFYHQS